MLEWGPKWTVADGENVTFYDPRLGSYQRWSLAEPGFTGSYPAVSALIGPLPAGSLDQFMEDWRATMGNIQRVGAEEFLGRRVEVLEYEPTSSLGVIGRFYVDADAGFILRQEMESIANVPSFSAEVTLLDLDPTFESDTFDGAVPSEAVAVSDPDGGCATGRTSPRGSAIEFSQMPLQFAHMPEGWSSLGMGVSMSSACELMEEVASLQRAEGELIVITQALVPPTGLPAVRRDAVPIAVAGTEGYHLTVGDLERLLWVQDGVIVLIESNAASLEELLQIAESAE